MNRTKHENIGHITLINTMLVITLVYKPPYMYVSLSHSFLCFLLNCHKREPYTYACVSNLKYHGVGSSTISCVYLYSGVVSIYMSLWVLDYESYGKY